jgi:hypothetical protein
MLMEGNFLAMRHEGFEKSSDSYAVNVPVLTLYFVPRISKNIVM